MLKKLNDKEYSLGTYFLPKIKNVAIKINQIIDFLNSANYTPNGETLYALDYGVTADGVTDDTAAFNTFMAACKAGQHKGELPIGTIRLASKPNNIDFPWDLGGKGLNSSLLLRDYNEASGNTGCLALVENSSGTRIHNLAIESSAGHTGGSMISAKSTDSYAISGLVFENLWLSTFGTNTQTNTFVLDGSLKVTAPTGLRDTCLKNVHIFGADGFSVILTSVLGLSWMGGGSYYAGGTNVASGGIQISGSPTNKSAFITFDTYVCNGLNLTNCEFMKLSIAAIGSISSVSINNDVTCSTTQVIGSPEAPVLGNWVNSGIRRPGAAYSTT